MRTVLAATLFADVKGALYAALAELVVGPHMPAEARSHIQSLALTAEQIFACKVILNEFSGY